MREERWAASRAYLLALGLIALSMAFPETLINFYLRARGQDQTWIGIFHASSQLGGLVLGLPAVWLFERIRRRVALWAGLGFATAVRLVTVMPVEMPLVLAAEALSGFGTVMFGLASVSVLADLTTPHDRAVWYGRADFVRIGATLVGGLLAGVLPAWAAQWWDAPPQSAESYRPVLVLAFLVRFAALIPLAVVARARDAAGAPLLRNVQPAHYLNLRALLSLPPRLYLLALPLVLVLTAQSLRSTFFSLFLRDWFGASDALVGATLGLQGVVGASAALAASVLAARWGYRRCVAGGLALSTVATIGLVLTDELAAALPFVFLGSAGFQAALVLYRVFAINAAPREEHFILSTLLALASNAGPTFGPYMSGLVLTFGGYGLLMLLAASLWVVSVGMFVWVSGRLRAPSFRPSPQILTE
ncbi:MAG: MFS transporter [Thermoflexales bacterium]